MFFKDFRRIKKLGKYLTKDKKTIYLILIVLLPVSFSGAIQPLLVGQAITILKNETTDVWLSKTFFGQSINAIILTLFITVLFRLVLQGYQTYNIQAVGQRLTARIRRELFDHSISLSLKYHDKMPVGKLLTRLTNDVDALAEVFGSGAVGVIADFVSLIVISLTMLSIDSIVKEITIRLTKSAMTPTAPLPKTSAKASTSFVNLVNNFPTGILS